MRQRRSVISRRQLLVRASVPLFAVFAAARCRGKTAFSCGAVDLPTADVQVRNRLGYVERSPSADKTCVTCTQFVPAASESGCGGCKVMKGPIHPDGTCKVYASAGQSARRAATANETG